MRSVVSRTGRRIATIAMVFMIGCGTSTTSTRTTLKSDVSVEDLEYAAQVSKFAPLDLPDATDLRTGSGTPGKDYWKQRADYVMAASLDADTREIIGQATITYTNNSPDPLDYIWLHLEQNIFRENSIGSYIASNTSIGMSRAEGNGYTIDYIRSPDRSVELNEYDTVGRVDLGRPIMPRGDQMVLEIGWRFTVPMKAFRRFGIEQMEQGTIFEVAQWFPAIAVYDDVYGWNTLGYLGTGEFYTDFGNYDVRLTVPRSHLVVASGELQNGYEVLTSEQTQRLSRARQSRDTVMIRDASEVDDPASRPAGSGDLTWHFKGDDIRTFAWASSDAFIYDACAVDGTLVQSVYPKEAMPLWGNSTQMLRTAIEGYNARWYPYPYPVATNVNGPEGGMEYPMIIFCGARRSERGLYGVTTHEIGHNWFPMLVSTDERRHAWMDEGFNTFINYYSFGEWFDGELGRRGNPAQFAPKMIEPGQVPIAIYPDRLPRNMLGRTQYEKPAVGLVLLREQILGPERFDAAFRTYIERWAYKSPRPADFFRIMEDVAGMDLAWFWRGWFYTTWTMDQAVQSVTMTEAEDEAAYEVAVSLRSLNEFPMPVAMRVTYEDGSVEDRRLPVEIWYTTDEFTARWMSDQKVTGVQLDPDEGFPDVDRSNNTWGSPAS